MRCAVLHSAVSDNDLRTIFHSIDVDGSGVIDIEEFLIWFGLANSKRIALPRLGSNNNNNNQGGDNGNNNNDDDDDDNNVRDSSTVVIFLTKGEPQELPWSTGSTRPMHTPPPLHPWTSDSFHNTYGH